MNNKQTTYSITGDYLYMSNIITQFRENVANYKLKKQLSKSKRQRGLYNLKTASSAGILFNAGDEANYKVVKELVKELKNDNITSQVLGYIDKSKRDDNYIGDQTYTFACKSDFSFFYSIKKDSVSEFVNQNFNLLIVLVKEQPFAIDYLGRLSKAKFKVGKAGLDNELYDLMIELKEDQGLPELKKQIIHYLSILNNN